MRMRYKPYARSELAAWPNYVQTPGNNKGQWQNAFKNPKLPLRVELGCGKGGFLAQTALRESEYNYLGIDIKSEVLVVAKRNIQALYTQARRPIGNVLITSWEIENINEIIGPEDRPGRLYINFCNPWSKSGHAKHRLTHPRQLVKYRRFLCPGAEIYFKTDNLQLFNASLRYFEYTGFAVTWKSEDLHNSEPVWNTRTEHENMFSQMGMPIYAAIAGMQNVQLDEDAILRMKNL